MNTFYQKIGRASIRRMTAVIFFVSVLFISAVPAQGQNFISKLLFIGRDGSFEQKQRTMKDLLRAAIDQAVYEASQVNGFYHQPDLRIGIPEKVREIEKISRKIGGNLFWHDFELGLNRAAEKAAPRAAVLMKDALEGLEFEKDPEEILVEEGSLTNYFRRKTEDRLKQTFKQEIERSISAENALAPYLEMKTLYSSIPFVKNSDKVFALEDELCSKTLDGIFSRIEDQENRLRSVRA